MPIDPWMLGATRPAWTIVATQDAAAGGGAPGPLNLTGATITLHGKIADTNGNPSGSDQVGTGVIAITDALNGKYTYTPSSSDFFVVTAGTYICQWFYNYGAGAIVEGDFFTFRTLATV